MILFAAKIAELPINATMLHLFGEVQIQSAKELFERFLGLLSLFLYLYGHVSTQAATSLAKIYPASGSIVDRLLDIRKPRIVKH